jgi:hypothetical protein
MSLRFRSSLLFGLPLLAVCATTPPNPNAAKYPPLPNGCKVRVFYSAVPEVKEWDDLATTQAAPVIPSNRATDPRRKFAEPLMFSSIFPLVTSKKPRTDPLHAAKSAGENHPANLKSQAVWIFTRI